MLMLISGDDGFGSKMMTLLANSGWSTSSPHKLDLLVLVEGERFVGWMRYMSDGDSEVGERSSGVLLVDSILQERWMGEGDGGAGGETALSGSEVGC